MESRVQSLENPAKKGKKCCQWLFRAFIWFQVIMKIKPNLRLWVFDCQIFLRGTKIIFISRCEQKINFNLLHKSKTNKSDLTNLHFSASKVKVISLFSGIYLLVLWCLESNFCWSCGGNWLYIKDFLWLNKKASIWLPLHVHNHETPWKNPGHVFPGKKNWNRIFGQKKSRPNLWEKIKQIITSIDHCTTSPSPSTVTDWQIKSLCLFKDCYNGYKVTSKNLLSSFQSQLH